MSHTLVLLRHGQSVWNLENLFTGWYDAPLTELGEHEARTGGELLLEKGVLPDTVHTSLQTRAIRTAELSLAACDRSWIPVRRHWRLNERHYGDLTGRDKAETAAKYGDEQVHIWRRSYDTPPPAIEADNRFNPNDDPRYAHVPPELRPASECLKDVVERMLPYWFDQIVPDLADGHTVLVAAHGNSLRALVKHLDHISDDEIPGLNIPTGQPLVYELDDDFHPVEDKPVSERYLADPDEVAAAAAAVEAQAKGQ
ncbi:MAG TPA: phosphoglyceromutase [Acidimicrobiaceae bacterium]|nr:phosphoglyceromutase [Acidimicrobiaceae bacterium]